MLVVVMILKDTATFQVLFMVSLFCTWNITTVEINSGVHLLKVKSAKCLCLLLWSWSCYFGLGLGIVSSGSWSCHFGLGLKNLVLFTSLLPTPIWFDHEQSVHLLKKLNPPSAFVYFRWSWSCHFGLGLVSSGLGLGLKKLVLFTSLVCIEMKPVVPSDQQADSECLKLADHIATLVLDKFSELTNQLTSESARRKVLAGVVMTSPSSESRVICVTTGTKCISGEYLSDGGTTVNDCHAEVLARRCLCRFLYLEIQQYVAGAESIFVPSESGSGFSLKPGIEFHLYISSAPCGDARIFSPHEVSSKEMEVAGDKHPNRLARGQLRTKIESGEGTIPVQSSDSGVQTWDGIMLGERLLTMSCSDKVARMNVLGVQGQLFLLCSYYFYLFPSLTGVLASEG